MLDQTPRRFGNLVFEWCLPRIAPDKLDEWLDELEDLLPWEDSNSEAAAEIESASWERMAAKNGGG